MTDHDRGQLDTGAAEVYESLFVPALFGRFAAAVADAAAVGPTDSVLDVGCGAGALTKVVRGQTKGRVVGVDINPAMVAVARRGESGIEYVEGDASRLHFGDGTFDVAVSQFGLMFLDDPAGGVREMARVGRRGLVAVWDSIERSEGYLAMQELFRAELGDGAASSLDAPFAMGRDGVLETVVDGGAVKDAEFRSIEGTGRFESIAQWVATEVRGWTLGDSISDSQLADLISKADARLGRFATDDGVVFGVTAKLASWIS